MRNATTHEQIKVNKTDVAWFWNQTKSGFQTNKVRHPLAYGSAKLEGFKYQDFVCLKPMNTTEENMS